ncbi:MAG: FtsX-like permease family protein [Gemmatimonadota bacterium]|nr:FtsX-like permease family protein [Gemmatimonadota bacterium]
MSGAGRRLDRVVPTLYRWALRLYPSEFRREYGELMLEDARELLDRGGPDAGSTPRRARRLFTDLIRSLGREWARALGESALAGLASGGLATDRRAAVRSLSRRPRFTLGVMGLLAVGVAACVAVASVVSAYVLRPLPYPDADRIVTVSPAVPVMVSEVDDLFELAVSWDLDVYTLLDEGDPEMVYGAWVSDGYLELYGLRTALGRRFTPDERRGAGGAVAIISHELWQTRYGGDPDVVGRRLAAFTSDRPDDAETFTIVGVLAADTWHHDRYIDFLTPLFDDRMVYSGRLHPGVDPDAAARLLEQRGVERMTNVPDDLHVELIPLQERYTAALVPVLRVGVATVLLALLIACGNTAALLLVRAAGRDREFTVRRALGAGRGRLARQLLIEGFVLAGGAALIGLALAAGALAAFRAPIETHLGRSVPGGLAALMVDGRALALTLGLALATGLAFGLTPMAGAMRRGRSNPLADGGRGSTGGRSRRRGLGLIVAGGVALSLTLIVPATLALRSARHVAALDPGFEAAGVFTGGVLLRSGSYPEAGDRAAFFEQLTDELRVLPGVEAVGASVSLPFGGRVPRPVEAEDPGATTGVGPAVVEAHLLSHDEGFLETIAVPLLAGRSFGPEDTPDAEPVAMVSRELGERLWPGEDPLDRRLRIGGNGMMMAMDAGEDDQPWLRVVGVVPGVRMAVDDTTRLNLHLPLAQTGSAWANVALRLAPGAPPPIAEVKRAMRALDPTLALSETGFLWASVVEAGRPARFLASLLGLFAAFAIAVALVGLYAVLSFAASERTREVAIRMAIGARSGEVVGLFMRRGMLLVAGGIVLGLGGAALLSRGIDDQLHGASAGPLVYTSCAAALAAVAAVAAWLPARRASRGDPMETLRAD